MNDTSVACDTSVTCDTCVTLAGIPGSPAAIYNFRMDAAGVQSCRVQSEGVRKEPKGLQGGQVFQLV